MTGRDGLPVWCGMEDRSWWFPCLVEWRTGRGGLPVWWGG